MDTWAMREENKYSNKLKSFTNKFTLYQKEKTDEEKKQKRALNFGNFRRK